MHNMSDQLSVLYGDLLEGSYDCVDRVVLNAYFSMGQSGGGFRVWWRALHGSDENLDDNHLMRMAGRFSRRLRAWAKANDIPVMYCSPGERKHEIAEEHLATHETKPGAFHDSCRQSTGAGLGGADDGHWQTRSTRDEGSVALCQSLFLSYSGTRIGGISRSK